MKKVVILLTLLTIIVSGCTNKNNHYDINDDVKIKGTVLHKKVIVDGNYETQEVLSLTKPIVIDNDSLNKIIIKYDKGIKDNSNVLLSGKIAKSDSLDTYVLEVYDIDDENAIINTFSNDSFVMTIPPSLIKMCEVKEVENGFAIYSLANLKSGGEVFRILAVTSNRFKSIQNNQTSYIEKVDSDMEKTIIVVYPKENQIDSGHEDEYETIGNAINIIKDNIRLK